MSKVLTRTDGHVLTITINRPEAMNALDPETQALMSDAFDDFAADDALWVAVVRGAGGRAFSAGGDIRAMRTALEGGAPYTIPATGYGGLTSRFDLDKPVIAAVEGIAMGGGFEVAMACDLVLATRSASFALPEPRIGAVAYAGGMHRLPRQIGMKRAMELLLTARSIDAAQAAQWGLVNEVVDDGALDAAIARWCELLCANAPLALRATKAAVRDGLALPVDEAIRRQDAGGYPAIEAMRGSRDVVEGIMAFNQKRAPVWEGR
ncbi:enoyl-CoA hydratase-related protein [Parazoarcus communis]|uniref:Enoyl-CoA hydratase n=1 Tax=Parazoarcus communis SWub3 = DSM 12120 TaxID=1121029 RepID=A0A323V1U5_9RHOO|nr:enoyl-CoA hydratase-related protein [Parazoarcus communis]NMG69696.1 enoyl-CoA hydratase [Parazoarcus communis SWub3 = DSM 12120]PZA18000.1 enoyl-CoA hydratase [Azoarcus communis] [Parazoarcus communis SWub3 = DSM 12120]